MKKYLLTGLITLGLALAVLPRSVRANEGTADLRGTGTSGACFVVSVYIEGNYKVMATCRDLKIALTPEKNRYLLWTEDEGGKQRRLGEIVAGKLLSSIDSPFVRLFVTVERDPYANKPSADVVLTGTVKNIDFGPGVAPAQAIVTPTPTPTRTTATPGKTQEVTPSQQNGLASALGTILKVVLLGFGALLIVVGVSSFLSRRRSL